MITKRHPFNPATGLQTYLCRCWKVAFILRFGRFFSIDCGHWSLSGSLWRCRHNFSLLHQRLSTTGTAGRGALPSWCRGLHSCKRSEA